MFNRHLHPDNSLEPGLAIPAVSSNLLRISRSVRKVRFVDTWAFRSVSFECQRTERRFSIILPFIRLFTHPGDALDECKRLHGFRIVIDVAFIIIRLPKGLALESTIV